MSNILLIETATEICSVAMADGENILSLKESRESNVHSTLLTVFIDQVIKESGIDPAQDLSAVAVSIGPGSYTGLRIGLSAGKGLCYSLGIPLISIPTLQSLANGVKCYLKDKMDDTAAIGVLLDARRMEVYSGFYNYRLEEIRYVQPDILEEGIYDDILKSQPVYFCGNGAEKSKPVLSHPNAHFLDELKPSAQNMALLALWKYSDSRFDDVAYTEPVYLKEFYTKAPKKLI